MNPIRILHSLYHVKRSVSEQKAFNQEFLLPTIASFRKKIDLSLSIADLNRIYHTDAINISVVIGEAFAGLRGLPLIKKEREAITNMAALTLLYDDYFDRFDFSKDEILKLMSTEEYNPKNAHESLYRIFFDGAINSIPDTERLFFYANKVFDAQYDSKRQESDGLSYADILELTRRKGGFSILFYRTALSNPMDEAETQLAYDLGGLIQLGDDIFDTFWDANDKLRTFTTISRDLRPARRDFQAQVDRCLTSLADTDYPAANKAVFKAWMLFAASLSFSALDQLDKLQEETIDFFDAIAYKRSEMICDMQKLTPQLRAFKHLIRLNLPLRQETFHPELISPDQFS